MLMGSIVLTILQLRIWGLTPPQQSWTTVFAFRWITQAGVIYKKQGMLKHPL